MKSGNEATVSPLIRNQYEDMIDHRSFGHNYELSKLPAPSWLNSSVGRALHRYSRSHGFESLSSLNYSTTAYVVRITGMDR